MLTMPSALIAEKNKLFASGAFLELLEAELSQANTTIRLVNNNEDVVWNSLTWQKFYFQAGDISESEEGENHTLEIKISNINRVTQGLIESVPDGLVGDKINYYLIHSENLNAGAAISASFNILSVTCDEVWCTFTLGIENFFLKKFPLHNYSRNVCRYEIFKGTECGYAGAQTTCDRKFSTCISYSHQARFGGQPAIPGGLFDAA